MTTSAINNSYPRFPNLCAWLLAAIVFPLIWVGGLVTTSDAGMAVPDWPNTYNYNMFAYPVRDWILGPWDLFVEHGHRLLGSLAGVVSILLCLATFAFDMRPIARTWSVIILGLVIGQGVLGGQRVVQDQRLLALIHGCLGPAFFATVVAMIVFTSRWWMHSRGSVRNAQLWSADGLRIAAGLMLGGSYLQLVFGACLRHIPDVAQPSVYLLLIVAHLVTAGMLLLVSSTAWYIARADNWQAGGVRGPALMLLILVLVQIGLGVSTYVLKFGWPAWMGSYSFAASYVVQEKTFWQVNWITLHVAVGSLILAAATFLCARVFRSVGNRVDWDKTIL